MNEWVMVDDREPSEAKDCEYGFVCWVDGEVEMAGVEDGISWDEVSFFMPMYDIKRPDPPKHKRVNDNFNIGSTTCNVL